MFSYTNMNKYTEQLEQLHYRVKHYSYHLAFSYVIRDIFPAFFHLHPTIQQYFYSAIFKNTNIVSKIQYIFRVILYNILVNKCLVTCFTPNIIQNIELNIDNNEKNDDKQNDDEKNDDKNNCITKDKKKVTFKENIEYKDNDKDTLFYNITCRLTI